MRGFYTCKTTKSGRTKVSMLACRAVLVAIILSSLATCTACYISVDSIIPMLYMHACMGYWACMQLCVIGGLLENEKKINSVSA